MIIFITLLKNNPKYNFKNMLYYKIKKYLSELDNSLKTQKSINGELTIARCIITALHQNINYKMTSEDKAEFIAFDAVFDYQNIEKQKTYYKQKQSLSFTDKQIPDPPSIEAVDKRMLNYWEKRAKETKNPILLSRYADLVVSLSAKILNKNPDVNFQQSVIDSNIMICEMSLQHHSDCKTKAKRALSLSVQINDPKRIVKAKNTIISLDKCIASGSDSCSCGFAFRVLLLDFSEKLTLDDTETNELLIDAEARLKKMVTNDLLLTECAGRPLAKYYARINDEKNLMRILHVIEVSLKEVAQLHTDVLTKLTVYDRIYELYKNYECCSLGITKICKKILHEINQLYLNYENLWSVKADKVEVEKVLVDNYLETIFGKTLNTDLKSVMHNIAFKHLSKKIKPQKALSDNNLLNNKLSSKVTSYYDYSSNHLQYFPHSQRDLYLFLATICELNKRYTKETIIKYFTKYLVLNNDDEYYLKQAISSYLDTDYLTSSHLFIPFIESRIRKIIRTNGIPANELNAFRKHDYKPFSNLLNKSILKEAYLNHGEQIVTYFKEVLLNDPLGMNLRNDFAHGLRKRNFFLHSASDRLFHILILLSLANQ